MYILYVIIASVIISALLSYIANILIQIRDMLKNIVKPVLRQRKQRMPSYKNTALDKGHPTNLSGVDRKINDVVSMRGLERKVKDILGNEWEVMT